MNMLRIDDMVTLRQVALDMALRRCENDYRRVDEVIALADRFSEYIRGRAELPESPLLDFEVVVDADPGIGGECDVDGYDISDN